MSTYFHLRCTAHTPHIRSDDIGKNCEDVIVEVHRNRDAVVRLAADAAKLNAHIDYLWDASTNTAAFLVQHPTCNLELWDEYGHQWCLICGVVMEAHEGKVLCQQYEVTQWLCASCNGSMTS